MNELISVIVPCYNIETLVRKTVNSIQNQNYSNLEIILVDDGSEDGTLKVLEQLAVSDNRIKVIHQENGGVTRARLAGIVEAMGEWIGFVDGDDFVEPEMYERLLYNAHQYNADISHCGYQMVFPSRIDYYYNTGRLVQQDKLTGLKDLLDGSFIEPGLCNKLFRKTLFHSLLHDDVMDLSIKINEDLLMNYYLFKEANQAIFEDFCPYHYMVRKGSAATSSINENKLRDPLRVQKILKKNVQSDIVLSSIVDSKIAEILVQLSTMADNSVPLELLSYKVDSQRELRKMVPMILKGTFSTRLKVLSAWAAYAPKTYRTLHQIYMHIKGTDRKYEVS